MAILCLKKVVSGFQSGADLGAILIAQVYGLETGGWMPKGWKTESGPHPEYASLYGAKEHTSPNWRPRSGFNVRDSDATLCFDLTRSRSTRNAEDDCDRHVRPFTGVLLQIGPTGLIVPIPPAHTVSEIADWIVRMKIAVLNVCGNRESKSPGIGAFVQSYLADVFWALKRRAADEIPSLRRE